MINCNNRTERMGHPGYHGTIVRHGLDDHHGRSYKLRVSKIGHSITRTQRHTRATMVMAKEYLGKWMS